MHYAAFLVFVALSALVFIATHASLSIDHFENRMNGEARLRQAVGPLLNNSRPHTGTEEPSTEPGAWSELFAQSEGGQLFMPGYGSEFHSASDVYANSLNPYAKYLLEYDKYVSQFKPIIFPAIASFSIGIRDIFCNTYTTSGGKTAYTVCDYVANTNNKFAVRSFVNMLETIVVMKQVDDALQLRDEKVQVTEETKALADKHQKEVEQVMQSTTKLIKEEVDKFDGVMNTLRAKFQQDMRVKESRAKELESKISEGDRTILETSQEIADMKRRLSEGSSKLGDTALRMEELRLKIKSTDAARSQDQAALKNLNAKMQQDSHQWAEYLKHAKEAQNSAILLADESVDHASSLSQQLSSVKDRLQQAQSEKASLDMSLPNAQERLNALRQQIADMQMELENLRTSNKEAEAEEKGNLAKITQVLSTLAETQASADNVLMNAPYQQQSALEANKAAAQQQRSIADNKVLAEVRLGHRPAQIQETDVSTAAQAAYRRRDDVLRRQDALVNAQLSALRGESTFIKSSNASSPAPAPAPAPPPPPPPPTPPQLNRSPLRWSKSSRVIECNKKCSKGAPIQLWDNKGGDNQVWTYSGQTLTAQGQCMDIDHSGTQRGTGVQAWDCNGGAAQKWEWVQNSGPGPGAWQLRNPNSGLCLDVSKSEDKNGARLQIWDCNVTQTAFNA